MITISQQLLMDIFAAGFFSIASILISILLFTPAKNAAIMTVAVCTMLIGTLLFVGELTGRYDATNTETTGYYVSEKNIIYFTNDNPSNNRNGILELTENNNKSRIFYEKINDDTIIFEYNGKIYTGEIKDGKILLKNGQTSEIFIKPD